MKYHSDPTPIALEVNSSFQSLLSLPFSCKNDFKRNQINGTFLLHPRLWLSTHFIQKVISILYITSFLSAAHAPNYSHTKLQNKVVAGMSVSCIQYRIHTSTSSNTVITQIFTFFCLLARSLPITFNFAPKNFRNSSVYLIAGRVHEGKSWRNIFMPFYVPASKS